MDQQTRLGNLVMFSSDSEDDPLDAGLRAAYAPVSVMAGSDGDSVAERLSSFFDIRGPVSLRDETREAPESLQPVPPQLPGMPAKYQVSGELARGGIGIVLKGRDVDLGREVALKVLRTEHAENHTLVRRLVEEAQIGGQLQHPGILPVYEMGLDAARRPFFAMKLVRGRTLADLLATRVTPESDLEHVLGIFEQLAHTVAYAHARGVIHRDLKPSNVMVGSFNEVQVVDWGLAKVLSSSDSVTETRDADALNARATATSGRSGSDDARSEDGSVLGTPAYMPPEQARGEIDRLDERSDVFGLGAILCEILTGGAPYAGSRQQLIEQARAGRIEPALRQLDRCGASGDLVDLARLCLSPERDNRPRDASIVAREVQAYRESTAARARSAEVDAARARARADGERRVRFLTLGLAGVIALAATIGVGLFVRSEREALRAERALLLAERNAREIDRQRSARLEAALEVLIPLEEKGQYVLMQASSADDSNREKWIYLLRMIRGIALRTAATAPTAHSRERAQRLAEQLEARAAELSAKAEKTRQGNHRAAAAGQAP
jgi:serine/threonine-protein kinase